MLNNSRSIQRSNQSRANLFRARGDVKELGRFLLYGSNIANFVISGGHSVERQQVLEKVFQAVAGRVPVIVISTETKRWDLAIKPVLNEQCLEPVNSTRFLRVVNSQSPSFEPFLGMDEEQVVSCFKRIAMQLGYTVVPTFERCVRAHMEIMKMLTQPVTLSAFYYLSGFENMGEFYENVMSLPCGNQQASRIWMDLGAGNENADRVLDMFRSVVRSLAQEARYAGWSPDNANDVTQDSVLRAINENSVMVLAVNSNHTEVLFTYLAEELKCVPLNQPFVLILDDVRINDSNFIAYLRNLSSSVRCGIVTENMVDMFGDDENAFPAIAEKMECFIILKHRTGKTAEKISELIGTYEYTRIETSGGVGRRFFHIMPQERHEDYRISTEERFRVMPEDITALGVGQAILFNAQKDQIVYYN